MAKLPKVIRDINRRGFANGGTVYDSEGNAYLVSEDWKPGDPLGGGATVSQDRSSETALAYATTPPPQKTTLTEGEQPAVAQIQEQPGEILSGTDVQLGADPTTTTAQASTTGIEIPSSNAQAAAQYSNYFVNQNTPSQNKVLT